MKFPFLLGTATMELIHSVGVVTGAMMSWATRSSSASLSFGRSTNAMRRGAC